MIIIIIIIIIIVITIFNEKISHLMISHLIRNNYYNYYSKSTTLLPCSLV